MVSMKKLFTLLFIFAAPPDSKLDSARDFLQNHSYALFHVIIVDITRNVSIAALKKAQNCVGAPPATS